MRMTTGEIGKLELETQCKCCAGTGLFNDVPCPDCKGSGVELTEMGERLLSFVVRNLELSQRNRG
jgi:DnaJ-class molecular chaperone